MDKIIITPESVTYLYRLSCTAPECVSHRFGLLAESDDLIYLEAFGRAHAKANGHTVVIEDAAHE